MGRRKESPTCNMDCFNCIHPDCIRDGYLPGEKAELSKINYDLLASSSDPKAKKKARQKKWYEANKDKMHEYYLEHREKAIQYNRVYYETHREELAAKKKVYYQAHREAYAARNKAYAEANREKLAAKQRAYYKANREAILARRKALKEARRLQKNAPEGVAAPTEAEQKPTI